MKHVLPRIVFWLLFCLLTRVAAQQFSPAKNYSVGTKPVAVVVGDFNRDSRMDLAVANSKSNNVSILLGNGDGTFRPAVNYALHHPPAFVCVGDFNGDHKSDLAFADLSGTAVAVLLGKGDGSFRPPVQYDVGIVARYLIAADFNHDKKLDLLAYNEGKLSILLGNGDGTFQPPVIILFSANSPHVAVADFNGDGFPDVIGGELTGVVHEGYSGNLIAVAWKSIELFGDVLVDRIFPERFLDV